MTTKYLQVSENHYIGLDDYKFYTRMQLRKPHVMYVPPYLNQPKSVDKLVSGVLFEHGELKDINNITESTDTVRLRNLSIKIGNNSEELVFYDSRTKKRHRVAFSDSWISVTGNNMSISVVISINGNEYAYKKLYIENPFKKFYKIASLHQKIYSHEKRKDSFALNYGMTCNQFSIMYHDKLLDGKCLIFIYGIWGILLRDDLSIDALVLIGGQKGTLITIDHFLWTSNPYITKFILMMKK